MPDKSSFDRIFLELPKSYTAVAQTLRETIDDEAPDLQKKVKWNSPFWVGHRDVVCLQCYPDHVNLGFLRGAELAPSFPELEGTGKAMRHLKVPSVTTARSSSVRRIIRAAVALDARTP